jgi:hypothetical protein
MGFKIGIKYVAKNYWSMHGSYWVFSRSSLGPDS